MSVWDGEVMFAVEFEFLFDDTEWFLGDFTFDCPVQDIIRDLGNVIREFVCRNDLFYFGEWWFVVGPVEDVILDCLFFGERIIFLCYCFIIPKRTQR